MRWLVPDLRGSEAPSQVKDTQKPEGILCSDEKESLIPVVTRPIEALFKMTWNGRRLSSCHESKKEIVSVLTILERGKLSRGGERREEREKRGGREKVIYGCLAEEILSPVMPGKEVTKRPLDLRGTKVVCAFFKKKAAGGKSLIHFERRRLNMITDNKNGEREEKGKSKGERRLNLEIGEAAAKRALQEMMDALSMEDNVDAAYLSSVRFCAALAETLCAFRDREREDGS